MSLCNRVLSPKYSINVGGKAVLDALEPFIRKIGTSNQLVKLSRRTFLETVDIPGKRKIYARAIENLEKFGFQDEMGRLGAFIKVEPVCGETKGSADPRMIQAPTPEYNVEFGRFYKPIEHLLLRLKWKKYMPWMPEGRIIAKGLNNVQRGQLIARKAALFDQFCCVGADARRFDQSVSKPFTRFKHKFYLACYGNNYYLKQLLWHQLRNRGKTKNGIKYTADGGVASGNQDTGGGNSFMCVTMVGSYFAQFDVRWDMLCDGDDVLIFVEKRDLHILDGFVAHCASLGFEMAMEKPAYELSDIEFCQSHPLETVPGKHVMVRKPARAISRAAMSHHSMNTVPEALQTLWAIGSCELAMHAGVPIMQEFALWCLRNGIKPSGRKLQQLRYKLSHQYWVLPKAHKPMPIHPYARASFALAFGVSPGEQLLVEKAFREHSFQLSGKCLAPEPDDAGAGPVFVQPHWIYR